MSKRIAQLYCLYTDNFEPFLIRFLSGLTDIDYVNPINLTSVDKNFSGLGGGANLWTAKAELLMRLSDPSNNPSDVIYIIMDIDVCVYGPLLPDILKALEIGDIVFQREWPESEEVNIGVLAFRPSKLVFEFWSNIFQRVLSEQIWDQRAVNEALRVWTKNRELIPSLLPFSFWAYSQTPEVACKTMPQVIMHHANCAETRVQKWEQMNRFASLFCKDIKATDIAFRKAVQNISHRKWKFGNISFDNHFSIFECDEFGKIRGFKSENEAYIDSDDRFLYIKNSDGNPTTIFNEFYFDPFFDRLLCVGRFLCREGEFHYLISS